MKNIFKKNHIIIICLAIMIVIAGYLSLTNRDANDKTDKAAMANPDTEEYDEYTELDGTEMAANTTENTTPTVAPTGTGAADTGTNDTTNATDTGAQTTISPAATQNNTGDLGKKDSGEDVLASAQDVSDNGELNLEEGTPGEAVLASAAVEEGFFINTKLDREQLRAKSKESLAEIINNAKLSDELKNDAIKKSIELTTIMEKEDAAEMLLEAKGFANSVVYINGGKVDVVVDAKTLSEQQLAIIESVVKQKTEIAVDKINIVPTVVSE